MLPPSVRIFVAGQPTDLRCGFDALAEATRQVLRQDPFLCSLTESCKRHDIDPWAYLKDVLLRIETQPPGTLAELLPHNWKAARERERSTASGP